MIPSEKGVRVLFAAAGPDTHGALVGILRTRGQEVTVSPDPGSAWAAFKTQPYPMVVIDRTAPAAAVDELCARIRSHPVGADSVILMLTGPETPEVGEAALNAGADDYISGTASPDELAERLWSMQQQISLAQGRPLADDRQLRHEQQEREMRERYVSPLADFARDMVLVSDDDRNIVDCNTATLNALGYSREEILRLRADDLRAQESLAATENDFERTRQSGGETYETMLQRKDGSIFAVEVSQHAAEMSGRALFHASMRDITDRKATERRIEGLARLYQILYRTNGVMLHVNDEETLFFEICRIVEEAGMLGAIVRIADAKDGSLRAVTFSERLRPLVEKFPVFTDISGANKQTISVRAFNENRTIVEQDRQATTRDSQRLALFQTVGLRSAASFPLRQTGKRVGVITFDSAELGFFTPETVELLEQMAGNISFALDNFERERLRREAERALRDSEERFRSLTAMSSDWYWEQDENFRFTTRSSPTGRAISVPLSEILGKTRWELGGDRGPEARLEEHRKLLEAHKAFRNFEYSVVHPQRSPIYMSVSGDPVFDHQGRFIGYRGVGRNITDLKVKEDMLVETTNDLKVAYGKLADAQEQERRALARELHDQVGHNLTGLNLHLTRLQKELSANTESEMGRRIKDSIGLVEDTAQRVRHIMSSLRPPMMDDYGLFATLRWWSHESAARSGIAIEVIGDEVDPRLPNNLELTLFRVAQEALLNAIKHSKATRISVSLQALPESVQLIVSDDGKGMALHEGERGGRTLLRSTLGMLNMRERMEAIGGQLQISSTLGEGVHILASVPHRQC